MYIYIYTYICIYGNSIGSRSRKDAGAQSALARLKKQEFLIPLMDVTRPVIYIYIYIYT